MFVSGTWSGRVCTKRSRGDARLRCDAAVRTTTGDLMRATVACPGNDFRLGAMEAPPAIISTFLGDTLTTYLDEWRYAMCCSCLGCISVLWFGSVCVGVALGAVCVESLRASFAIVRGRVGDHRGL